MENTLIEDARLLGLDSKLKPSFKQAWLAELRNPRRKQDINLLCQADGSMCCLGVLYDTVADDYWYWDEDREVWQMSGAGDQELTSFDGTEFPTRDLLEKVGLSTRDARFLARANDDGYTFKEIAEVIDKFL